MFFREQKAALYPEKLNNYSVAKMFFEVLYSTWLKKVSASSKQCVKLNLCYVNKSVQKGVPGFSSCVRFLLSLGESGERKPNVFTLHGSWTGGFTIQIGRTILRSSMK